MMGFAFSYHFDIVRGLSNGVWWPGSSRQLISRPCILWITPERTGLCCWLDGLVEHAAGRAYTSTLVTVSPDTGFASKFCGGTNSHDNVRWYQLSLRHCPEASL